MGSATTTNLDLLESHVGPQREPAPDKPTRFGTICLNAVGNTASNKSTQLRVALKQATRFFCRLVLKRFVFRETANEINTFCKCLVCGTQRHIRKLFIKSFILLDQGHVFFSFTSMEEELLFAVGTATNKSIPLRGNSCAVSKPHKKRQIEIAHVELFQSQRWQVFSAVWNYRHFKMVVIISVLLLKEIHYA